MGGKWFWILSDQDKTRSELLLCLCSCATPHAVKCWCCAANIRSVGGTGAGRHGFSTQTFSLLLKLLVAPHPSSFLVFTYIVLWANCISSNHKFFLNLRLHYLIDKWSAENWRWFLLEENGYFTIVLSLEAWFISLPEVCWNTTDNHVHSWLPLNRSHAGFPPLWHSQSE